jgi:hypothetical protein
MWRFRGTSLALSNGTSLLAVGAPSAEVYNPATGKTDVVGGSGQLAAQMACWSPDGREVLYVSSDRRLMGAPVLQTGAALQAGAATTRFAISGKRWLAFDVSRDGTSLLALILENNADEQPLTALLHAKMR